LGNASVEAKNAARLDLAAKCLNSGNLAAANVLCWNVLDRQSDSAGAWNLLGVISVKLRLLERAVEFFRKAHELGLDGAEANWRQATAHAASIRPLARAEDRFLLVKAWGAGFWSDVSHVLGGLILAEATGRKPVVHWGKESRFGDGSGSNAFTAFFESVSVTTIDDLARLERADFFPPKWHRGNLLTEENAKWSGAGARLDAIYLIDRPEQVLVADFYISVANFAPLLPLRHNLAQLSITDLFRYAIQNYFRPRSEILDEARAFFTAKLGGAPFVAAHIRGSDKVGESTFTTDSDVFLAQVAGEIHKVLDKVDPACRIFLMTDDERVALSTAARYGDRVVMTESRRTRDKRGIHFHDDVDHHRLGVEVMIDVFVALQAHAFIGIGGSNVAAMAALLRHWPQGRCVLLGPSILLRRGQMSYLDNQFRALETPDE
jgi:protein O-GlcNAc transferase